MTPTGAKWSERVRDWRASGKTAEEFAAGHEFEPSTLRYWASRLKKTGEARTPTTMVRVVRRSSRARRDEAAGGELEVVLGDARIVVRRGFDAELLRQIAAALGASR